MQDIFNICSLFCKLFAVIPVAQFKKPSCEPFATLILYLAITCRRAPGSISFICASRACISLFCRRYFSICIKLSIKTTQISTKHSNCVTIIKTIFPRLLSVYFHSEIVPSRLGSILPGESKERPHGKVPAQRVISRSNPVS